MAIEALTPAECGVSTPLSPRLRSAGGLRRNKRPDTRAQVAGPCQCCGFWSRSKANPDEHKNRPKRRGPVGFRLRLADVAAGISIFSSGAHARLVGAHRALCVYSFVHRGTPERPGLVLGLDRGGNCRGIAYRVAAAKRSATIDYLRAREQVTMVYREAWRAVWLDDDPQQTVHALCYMVDRGHRQYAGRLPLARAIALSCARATAVPAPAAITYWRRSRNCKATAIATTICAGWPSGSKARTRRRRLEPNGSATPPCFWLRRSSARSRVSIVILQALEKYVACRARARSDRESRPAPSPAAAGSSGAARTGRN